MPPGDDQPEDSKSEPGPDSLPSDAPSDESENGSTEESPDDTTDESPDELPDDSADEMTDDATDDSPDEPPEDSTDESPDETTGDTTEDSSDDLADESPDETTGDTTEDSSDDLADESQDETSGDTTEDSSDDSADDPPDDSADDSPDDSVDEETDELAPDSSDVAGTESSSASASEATDESSDAPSDSAAATTDGGGVEHEVDSPDVEPTFGGAPDDEEMPLTDHIEEMLKRLFAVIVVMGSVSAVTFFVADQLINFFWYSYLPGNPEQCATGEGIACPRVYHPLGLLLARIKVASLVGFIVALPVFVYQTYLFMRPGLYPHERRYYLAAVPTSLLLALVGIAFSYFLVLPFIFSYFLFYSEDVADIAFGLTETFDLIILMMGLFAAIFQIPLFIMLAIMMGVTTRIWLEERRLLFWLGFGGLAFLFSPDPTGMAPLIVALTMIALFELTLLLLRWTGR